MGGRGPKRTPTSELAKRGSWRAKGRESEATPPNELPQCPNWLADIGRVKWQECIEILSKTKGLVTQLDGDFLALYCEAFEDFSDARDEIGRNGSTCKSLKGGQYQHPAVGRKNKAIERMRQFGALFGMSPGDRVGLNIGDDHGDDDPLVTLLRKRGSLI
jgi:P27 family predicted phage terminase small subunit